MEDLTGNDFQRVADRFGVKVAAIKVVQTVKTDGCGGFMTPGRPITLFEGHIFWHELKKRGLNPEKYVVSNEDILYPSWRGGHYYGRIREYKRLEKTRRIHEEVADASTSWGVLQVTGFNYVMCGYGCVNEMVKDMCTGEDKRLEAFARFIKLVGLRLSLKRKDWTDPDRGHNDSGYVQDQYDKKLEEACRRFTK